MRLLPENSHLLTMGREFYGTVSFTKQFFIIHLYIHILMKQSLIFLNVFKYNLFFFLLNVSLYKTEPLKSERPVFPQMAVTWRFKVLYIHKIICFSEFICSTLQV